MPRLLELNTFRSDAGYLTVFEKLMPGTIKRAFYRYGAEHIPYGGHRHKKTWNALICLHGTCQVYVHDGNEENHFLLEKPSLCLILEPQDWYLIEDFAKDAILLVLANEYYSVDDYIDTPYPPRPVSDLTRTDETNYKL